MEVFKKELDKMASLGNEKIKDIISKLKGESGQLKMQDKKSFENSDQLMEQLSEEIKKEIQKAGSNRLKEKSDLITRIIEELYLDILVIKNIHMKK